MNCDLDIFLDDEFNSQQSCMRMLDSDGMVGQRVTITTEVNRLKTHNFAAGSKDLFGNFFQRFNDSTQKAKIHSSLFKIDSVSSIEQNDFLQLKH